MSVRVASIGLSTLYFGLCVCIVWFTTGFIRGSAGDVLIVALLIHLLGIVWPHQVLRRAGACLTLALVLEGAQLLGQVDGDSPRWMHIVFGSTADPLDALLYVFSAALGVLGEWGLTSRSAE